MPLQRHGRPLKRWRWIGLFGPQLMLCAGAARIAGLPVRWWAVAEPGRPLVEGSRGVRVADDAVAVRAGGTKVALSIAPAGTSVEVASPHGRAWAWTRKQPVRLHGSVELGGRRLAVDGPGLVDESAGYHARRTAWEWTAGAGEAGGRTVVWNLVSGIHDAAEASERTVWTDGEPAETGPVAFAPGLDRIAFEDGELSFAEWCAREQRLRLGIFGNVYRQPFGSFAGELPGGLRLERGYGVMERHEARW
jgi:hypothetical protein